MSVGVIVVAVIACRSDQRATPKREPATLADGGLRSDRAAAAPTFVMLRSDAGTVAASPEVALDTLRVNCDAATAGSELAVACFSLGQLYDTGTFVAKDQRLAMDLHAKACGLGEMRACTELGVFYDDGVVVAPDRARAKAYFRQACDGGNGRGCNSLLLLHPATVTKVEVDYVLERYRAICDGGGDPEACMALGDVYRIGEHRPADARRAVELYAKACAADHPTGCNNLGAMYATGLGVDRDPAEAARRYARACALGSRQGCVNAGVDPATAPMQTIER